MSKYTIEQYEQAAAHADGIRSPFAGIYREACRAYAATLRQQAELSGVALAIENAAELARSWNPHTRDWTYADRDDLFNAIIALVPIYAPLLRTAPAEQGGMVDEQGAPALPWRSIDQLPQSDDLFWFMRGDTVDGPRRPQFGGYDADEWDYFAPCVEPPTTAALALNTQGEASVVARTPKTGRTMMELAADESLRRAPVHAGDDTERGLYGKYKVERNDGSSAPGGKHHACEYFVLDTTHDPFAAPALAAYADACAGRYPVLADDLRSRYSLHAERARVPGGYDRAWLASLAQSLASGAHLLSTDWRQRGYKNAANLEAASAFIRAVLAAAPSQPEDAGEVKP